MIISKSVGVKIDDTTMTFGNPIFLDATKEPFKLYGFKEDLHRLPYSVAHDTSEAVEKISKYSGGCRIRFKTNSDYIIVRAVLGIKEDVFTMPSIATQGFDIFFYKDGKYFFKGSFVANQGDKPYVESRLKYNNYDEKEVVIDCPICAELKELYIGLREGCEVNSPKEYKNDKPIICYGSSIVQGIGACRPGTLYTDQISRDLDMDVTNLGFGGAAKAELPIMNYISNLDMCAFIYDYDHNAPDAEYLKETHYRGYKIVRDKNPNLPIIMASKPDYYSDPETNEIRRQIILESFNKAVNDGDKNVYFVDGSKMYPEQFREISSVDGCHPNDLGYLFMSLAFEKTLKDALNII